jgi:hypothetical protein
MTLERRASFPFSTILAYDALSERAYTWLEECDSRPATTFGDLVDNE